MNDETPEEEEWSTVSRLVDDMDMDRDIDQHRSKEGHFKDLSRGSNTTGKKEKNGNKVEESIKDF